MTSDSQQIERIVRAVLQQLQATAALAPSALSEPSSAASSSVLRLADRLVTNEKIAGRLKGVECLQVERRAIVTPLVLDLLRQNKIRLERIDERTVTASQLIRKKWLVVRDDRVVIARLTAGSAVAWNVRESVDQMLSDMQRESGAALSDDSLGIIVTRDWAAETYKLAQSGNWRVASVDSVETARQAREQFQPQIFVVNSWTPDVSRLTTVLQEIATPRLTT